MIIHHSFIHPEGTGHLVHSVREGQHAPRAIGDAGTGPLRIPFRLLVVVEGQRPTRGQVRIWGQGDE